MILNNNLTLTIINILLNLIDVLLVLLPVLLSVAFMTIIERKQLAAHQRRTGPNSVGYYGILQPFHLWGIIPFGEGLSLSDFSLGVLYTLALSSLGVYGVLFAGWSANSKYAFLGSLRSTAAMISYELILSSAILIVILLTGSFNFTTIIESQQSVWFVVPLLPVFIFYFISILAETSRTPFDLQEAESELVAGFFTEHSSIIFVFFFLSEYSSIILFSCITSILFLGGYNAPELFVNDTFINLQSIVLGVKTCLICFLFVWVRATLPRLRYDQLISLCWLNLLPVAVAFIIFVPCILVAFDIAPY
nr:NADH dehydrogenase subunit 1 [Wolfiporia cocos]QNH92636.1 NADH dehydrogenase subunit 1 [Wolfiporia cocos]